VIALLVHLLPHISTVVSFLACACMLTVVRLRDVSLGPKRMQDMYDQCVAHMVAMFR
jgi:serine/threonine-protein kinase RIO1